jgi:hypothetical protein
MTGSIQKRPLKKPAAHLAADYTDSSDSGEGAQGRDRDPDYQVDSSEIGDGSDYGVGRPRRV